MGIKAHDTDFGRWVCVKPVRECNGFRRVYGELRPCPLYGKCVDDPRNSYEVMPERHVLSGCKFRELWPEGWRQQHERERRKLLRCFAYEEVRAYEKAVVEKYKETRNRNRREKRHKAYQERDAEKVQSDSGVIDDNDRGLRHYLLPCGEDCEHGCPHRGVCPYTDKDEDLLVERERKDRKREKMQVCRDKHE